jgi:hypothetical protein
MRSCLGIMALLLLAPCQSRQANPPAFAGGEKLRFKAEWRLVRAGDVALGLKNDGDSREARLQLRSTGLVSMLFPLDDLYLAQLNDNLCAVSTILTAKEGSRSRETKVTFDSDRRKASYLCS